MKEKGDFCVAGACYPEDHPESESHMQELKALKTKVDAGAELLLSQLFFDNHLFYADNKPAMMEAGIYYAVNQILDLLANDMHGIHLYTMNNPEVAKKICAGIQHLI